jgi:hypothetical protein
MGLSDYIDALLVDEHNLKIVDRCWEFKNYSWKMGVTWLGKLEYMSVGY